MKQVFLSYRQTNDAQRIRVRAFAQKLKDNKIDVILDQFLLDEKPAGPSEGWDTWSSDCALNTDYVLIIGTRDWFDCFENKQTDGTGLGAACEAHDLRHRIYKAGGIIPNIRVVIFDDADGKNVPGKLDRYHRFHAERDLDNIVRWLGEKLEPTTVFTPKISTPHNLPSLQPFYGREDELKKIADALEPESRTWGVLIDGVGGMGKTSLAVRAAYNVPEGAFEKIAFISLKPRELDDTGVRDLSGFIISGLAELFNELAAELGYPDIAKAPEEQRAKLLLDALRGTHTLLILDNLESLTKEERNTVFTFVKKLPAGCKAILTSRGRIGSGAEELILEKLDEAAALATLAKLAENNPALKKAGEEERKMLYEQTGGKPLLLRWTAGQIGKGSCVTIADAIAYLRSCPDGNDALEFIFGDLVEDFADAEMKALCALTYFTLPATVEHLATISENEEVEIDKALRSLTNRSLVVPSEEFETFTLVPLVADFLHKKRPEVIESVGDTLVNNAHALVLENGHRNYDKFPLLDAAWPTVNAALPSIIDGPSDRLLQLCQGFQDFLNFTGRWDEWQALSVEAEKKAALQQDFYNAGWYSFIVGWVHYLRDESAGVLACADRAESYFKKANAGIRESSIALRLHAMGYRLLNNYPDAIAAFRECVELNRSVDPDSLDVAIVLNDLGDIERISGDLTAAELNYKESLRICQVYNNKEGIATCLGSLAVLELNRKNWSAAEHYIRESLLLSEEVNRLDLIASNSGTLAESLLGQGKKSEALAHAQRAVDIYIRLKAPELTVAQDILAECQSETDDEIINP